DPRFLAEREEDETVEDERQPDPEDRPEERLPIGDLVGLAVEDPEVEGEEDRDQDEEARPERGRYGAKDHRSFSTATYCMKEGCDSRIFSPKLRRSGRGLPGRNPRPCP